jgi:hypothetical protein
MKYFDLSGGGQRNQFLISDDRREWDKGAPKSTDRAILWLALNGRSLLLGFL